MNLISKTIRLKARKSLTNIIREGVKAKYGMQADVCAIWTSEDGYIRWETTHTRGTLLPSQKIELAVRKQAGQNILTLAGIPSEEKDIPTIFLMPFPSLVKVIGLKRCLKLIKEWPGQSQVNGIDVVRYRLN